MALLGIDSELRQKGRCKVAGVWYVKWYTTPMSLIILRVVRKADPEGTYLQPQTMIQCENQGESQ